MSDCAHNWLLSRSKQFSWITHRKDWVEEKRWFMPPKKMFTVVSNTDWFGRIDEYYCSKCIEDKVVKRISEDQYEGNPKWWSEIIEVEYLYDTYLFDSSWWPDQFEQIQQEGD